MVAAVIPGGGVADGAVNDGRAVVGGGSREGAVVLHMLRM